MDGEPRAWRLRPSLMHNSIHAVGMDLRSRMGGTRGHNCAGSPDNDRTLPRIRDRKQETQLIVLFSPLDSRQCCLMWRGAHRSETPHLAGAVIPSVSSTPARSCCSASSVGVPSTCAK